MINEDIKFSIIVPCYNVEQFLDTCIESIIRQTYSNWELILINDGSTDKTINICKEYANNDKRIRIIDKENGGLVSARNAGFEVVSGDWHMYVDSDDWIDINLCRILAEKIKEFHNLDIIFWKFLQDLNGKPIKGKLEWKCKNNEQLYDKNGCKMLAINTLIYSSGIASPIIRCIRTEYARKNNIFHDHRIKQGMEGLDLSLKSFYYAQNALYINKYLYHYRYNPNSISKKIDEKNSEYIVDCLKVIKEKISTFEDKEKFIKYFHQRVIYALIAIAMSTYFHPNNPDSLHKKCRKFSTLIKENQVFKDAIRYANIKELDKLRKIVYYLIKYRQYTLIAPIASIKQYYLKKGKFKY